MAFTLRIDTENEAFEGNPGKEIARLLRKAATEAESQVYDYSILERRVIMDTNGNRVGEWNYHDDHKTITKTIHGPGSYCNRTSCYNRAVDGGLCTIHGRDQ